MGIAHGFRGFTLSHCTVTVSDSLQRVEWFGLFKLFTIHSVIEDPRLFKCITNSLAFAGLGVPLFNNSIRLRYQRLPNSTYPNRLELFAVNKVKVLPGHTDIAIR